MESRHEIIGFDNSFPIKCFIHKLGYVTSHWHRSLELIYVVAGQVDILVRNKKYELNNEDIILINSSEIHELSSDNCTMIALQINLEDFDKSLVEKGMPYFECNSTLTANPEKFDAIRQIIAKMLKVNTSTDGLNLMLSKALIYYLLYELFVEFKTEQSPDPLGQSQKYLDRLKNILSYVNENYKSDISLTDLAEKAYLSVPYLSKFFAKNMGINFYRYIQKMRMKYAVNELLTTNESVEAIAYSSGFPNPKSFVQLFKKEFQMLPSQYRKGNSFDHPACPPSEINQNFYITLDHHDYLNVLSKRLPPLDNMLSIMNNKKTTSILSCRVDVSKKTKPLVHAFKIFTSVGKAKEILYAEVQRMLSTLQKEIGFEYIKFHGIFSDDMFVYNRDASSKIIISFTHIDKVLDFLISIKLKPLIQLSFMPEALAKYPDKTVFNSVFITSEPNDMDKWIELVKQFMHHIVGRYGMDTVSTWKFCVWNEPETSEKMFGMSSDAIFYDFYKRTYQVVKETNKDFSFGSPSTYFTIKDTSRWLQSFTQWCKENNCLPDFINVHFYNTDFTNNSIEDWTTDKIKELKIVLSQDENAFKKFIDIIQSFRNKEYASTTPIYLTEWNSSPSHYDLISDTCFKSCYIIKNIVENYDRLGSFGYWTLTDFIEEYPLPEHLFHGGLGLFTYNGIRKPGYYAFYLLCKLGNEFVNSGDGYFITKSESTYQIMFYNYKHFSSLYANGETFDMTFENRYTPFLPEERREFNLILYNMPNLNYDVLEYTVNRKNGSCFDEWVRMGATSLNDEECQLLDSLSRPMINKYRLETSEEQLSINVILEQLEIRLLIATPSKS